jgi:NlpC/P60 family putative phage cell wall peptidase
MISRDEIVAQARRWIGTPYRHQASLIGAGTDCLGLIRGVWRSLVGEEPEIMPAYTADWSETTGEEVLMTAAAKWLRTKPADSDDVGDVIIFRMRHTSVAKHMGLAASRNGMPTFIHAYTGHGVIETPLSSPWRRKIAGRFEFPQGVK